MHILPDWGPRASSTPNPFILSSATQSEHPAAFYRTVPDKYGTAEANLSGLGAETLVIFGPVIRPQPWHYPLMLMLAQLAAYANSRRIKYLPEAGETVRGITVEDVTASILAIRSLNMSLSCPPASQIQTSQQGQLVVSPAAAPQQSAPPGVLWL